MIWFNKAGDKGQDNAGKYGTRGKRCVVPHVCYTTSNDVGELDEIGCPLREDIHWDLGMR